MKAPGMTIGKAVGQEATNLAGTANKAGRAFDIGNSNRTFPVIKPLGQ